MEQAGQQFDIFDALRDIDECHYQCNWTIKARAGSEDSRMKHWPRPPSFLKIFYIGLSLQTLIPVPKIFRILKKCFKPPKFSDPALIKADGACRLGEKIACFPWK